MVTVAAKATQLADCRRHWLANDARQPIHKSVRFLTPLQSSLWLLRLHCDGTNAALQYGSALAVWNNETWLGRVCLRWMWTLFLCTPALFSLHYACDAKQYSFAISILTNDCVEAKRNESFALCLRIIHVSTRKYSKRGSCAHTQHTIECITVPYWLVIYATSISCRMRTNANWEHFQFPSCCWSSHAINKFIQMLLFFFLWEKVDRGK